ncbi:hypothetical protein NDU88_004013 [Pleurodeles waltl]|uniref:CBM21 domain-containing protein n=1 Tax=Pleurodeles waltl TaxID=8319 RepID=A0AAV7LH38_PLEWA|nr:hypothetical protein NDU88_004013 [Pleurodeles waltl]
MKGLSLTAVRIFSKMEEDLCDLQLALKHLLTPSKGLSPSPKPYALDFPQPASDYLAFRTRLQHDQVCLEQCLIRECSLSGTVRVRNVGFEKKVHLRVTFDSWRSFRDVTCLYMHNTYGVADTDTFSFHVELPRAPGPQGHVEFCVSYQCGHAVYWDNNHGQNYCIQYRGGLCLGTSEATTHIDNTGAAVNLGISSGENDLNSVKRAKDGMTLSPLDVVHVAGSPVNGQRPHPKGTKGQRRKSRLGPERTGLTGVVAGGRHFKETAPTREALQAPNAAPRYWFERLPIRGQETWTCGFSVRFRGAMSPQERRPGTARNKHNSWNTWSRREGLGGARCRYFGRSRPWGFPARTCHKASRR